MLFLKLAGGLVASYILVAVLVTLAQDKLLFPGSAVSNGSSLPAHAQRLSVVTASGDRLIGTHVASAQQGRTTGSLVVGFGGNAWNADDMVIYLRSIFPGQDIVAFHYRGYGPSTGGPSAQAILDDALSIYDDVVSRLEPDSVVAVGFSLGAGPAAHLASSRPVAGAILVTPFDTLMALAREHYPWLPVRLLLRHRMDVAGSVADVPGAVAVIAASNDTVVPPRRTVAVRKSARQLVVDRVIAGAGHNDIYDRAEFSRAMQEALALIEAGHQDTPSSL
ncbi:MAG: alpha/beta fold hydrolase [Pseudomonadota bacterium]